jgi:hypothetical protein
METASTEPDGLGRGTIDQAGLQYSHITNNIQQMNRIARSISSSGPGLDIWCMDFLSKIRVNRPK